MELALSSASSPKDPYSYQMLFSGRRRDLFHIGTYPFERPLPLCPAILPLIPSAGICLDIIHTLASRVRHANTTEVPLATTMMSVVVVLDALL